MVQNRYNLADRAAEDVVRACERDGLGFLPWFPLATGDLAKPGGKLDEIADAHGASPAQVALAWLLAHASVTLPIPGTSSHEHLQENLGARELTLSAAEIETLGELAA